MDTIKGRYSVAFVKVFVAFIFTILLNFLCVKGLGVISWIVVLIPFVLMTVIVTMLLLILGLDPVTGEKRDVTTPVVAPTRSRHYSSKCNTFCGEGRKCSTSCKAWGCSNCSSRSDRPKGGEDIYSRRHRTYDRRRTYDRHRHYSGRHLDDGGRHLDDTRGPAYQHTDTYYRRKGYDGYDHTSLEDDHTSLEDDHTSTEDDHTPETSAAQQRVLDKAESTRAKIPSWYI